MISNRAIRRGLIAIAVVLLWSYAVIAIARATQTDSSYDVSTLEHRIGHLDETIAELRGQIEAGTSPRAFPPVDPTVERMQRDLIELHAAVVELQSETAHLRYEISSLRLQLTTR